MSLRVWLPHVVVLAPLSVYCFSLCMDFNAPSRVYLASLIQLAISCLSVVYPVFVRYFTCKFKPRLD